MCVYGKYLYSPYVRHCFTFITFIINATHPHIRIPRPIFDMGKIKWGRAWEGCLGNVSMVTIVNGKTAISLRSVCLQNGCCQCTVCLQTYFTNKEGAQTSRSEYQLGCLWGPDLQTGFSTSGNILEVSRNWQSQTCDQLSVGLCPSPGASLPLTTVGFRLSPPWIHSRDLGVLITLIVKVDWNQP